MIARFTRLPSRSQDTWQGGIFKAPMWLDDDDGLPYRPWGAAWVSLETGLVNMKLAESDGDPGQLALETMMELGFKFAQTRPSAIQVSDGVLGEQIAQAFGDAKLAVTVVPHL